MSHPKIHSPNAASIELAADALLSGRLVGLPTETVYGLAARGDEADAVDHIFAAKKRPRNNPLILHVADVDDVRSLLAKDLDTKLDQRLQRLQGLWPGPLTLIGPKNASILDHVTAGGKTVAIRIPDHPVALAVISAMKKQNRTAVPVAAPSANLSNYVSPTTAAHVAEGLGDDVEMILDGGPCRVGLESTIVYLGTTDTPPRILRCGCIGPEELAECLGEPIAEPKLSVAVKKEPAIAAPGQFAKHYSPRTPVVLLPQDAATSRRPEVLNIHFDPSTNGPGSGREVSERTWTFADDGCLETAAMNLYRILREADEAGFQKIEIVACQEKGIGIAIMDRLRRAAD